MCAKYYENQIMLSRVTAKNVGDVFFRHTVHRTAIYPIQGGPKKRNHFTVCNSNLSGWIVLLVRPYKVSYKVSFIIIIYDYDD